MDKPATSRTDRQHRLAAPWHGVPGRARRPRATQRQGTRPERRSTREPSFINEHPASSMSLRSHSIQNAQRQTALLQPSSRAAVDERRRTDPRAIQREQPRPTGHADSQRSPLQVTERFGAQPAAGTPRSRIDPAVDHSVLAVSMGDGGTVGCRTPRGATRRLHHTTNDGRDASCHVRRERLRVAECRCG